MSLLHGLGSKWIFLEYRDLEGSIRNHAEDLFGVESCFLWLGHVVHHPEACCQGYLNQHHHNPPYLHWATQLEVPLAQFNGHKWGNDTRRIAYGNNGAFSSDQFEVVIKPIPTNAG